MKQLIILLLMTVAAFAQPEVESRNRINLLTGAGTFRFAVIPVTGNYSVSGTDVAGMNLTNIVYAVETDSGDINFQLPSSFPNVFSVINVGTNDVNIIPSPGQHILIAPADGTKAYALGLTNRFVLKVHTLLQLNSTNVLVQSEFRPLPNIVNLVTNNVAIGGSGDAGGTNARQFGSLTLTNLDANPNVATQILAGANVTVTSNNAGVYTIAATAGSGDAGGTNSRQFGSLNLTNWSTIPTGSMANIPAVDWLTNATVALTNHDSDVLQSATNYANGVTNSSLVRQLEITAASNRLVSYSITAPQYVTVSGAGSGNTNYLITLSSNSVNHFWLGSSNVNLYTVEGGTFGNPIEWVANITNLSAINWGIRFQPGTNRWWFSSPTGLTNGPTVLTNNTRLVLRGIANGTNQTVEWRFYRPGL